LAAEFYDASENLIELAHEIIEECHSHLVEANIKYLFRTGNWEVKKRETWGQAKKVGQEVNFLTGYDFIITIHQEVWDQLNLEDRKALLDHELQHCSAGTDNAGNKIWYVQGHDLEDFHAIIRRHGLWSPALKKLENLLNQIELQFEQQPPQQQPETITSIVGRPDLKVINSTKPTMLLAAAEEPDSDDMEKDADDNDDFIDIEVIEDDDSSKNPEDEHIHDSGTGTEG
jgi:hypothetical protein